MRIYCLLLILSVFIAGATAIYCCKCTSPQDGNCWPSVREWRNFNESVNGAMLFAMPPSYQCHVPYYDAEACAEVTKVYTDRYWRINHPLALQQPHIEVNPSNNKGCIGTDNNSSFCFRGNLPYYVVNTTSVSQVQNTINFARDKNLRLVVKNTGHDFQGRSTGQAALSLWLHHMKQVSVSYSFREEGCGSFAGDNIAITAGPGVEFFELMHFVDERNLEFVGGVCPSLGLAGYVQGGGHGLLGPAHGMGADNVLQYKVVTANGQLRIANKCQNPDLFWALRGGGGGTYGVVVETTIKAYNATPIFGTVYEISASTDEVYEQLVNRLVGNVASWSDKGWSAYFLIFNNRTIIWSGIIRNANSTYALSLLSPFFDYINNTPGLSCQTILESAFPSLYPFWYIISRPYDHQIDGNLVLGSWLMPRSNFVGTQKVDQHTETIMEVLRRNEGGYVFMIMFSGGEVAAIDEDYNAVNPAWRKALTHSVITANLAYNATLAQRDELYQSISNQTQLFRNIAPQSGAYTNEADALEPNWQRAFYGKHYNKLKLIKSIYDPTNLFICSKCVGSEAWFDDLKCRK